jgi:hypothetical protein
MPEDILMMVLNAVLSGIEDRVGMETFAHAENLALIRRVALNVLWQRYDERTGRYREVPPSADGYYRSMAIPGLAMEVLPPAAWTAGRKVRVWFRGEEVRDGETEARVRAAAERQARAERLGREAAEQQASEAEERADRECARADRECAEKERLLDLLKQAGIDPGA